MGVAALEQQLTEYEFFMAIYKSTPSVVISSFGAVWLGAKMVMAIMDASKSISDAWLHHENNKVMLKEAKERLERNEIDTDIKRKELE